MRSGTAVASPTERDYLIMHFDKVHAKDLGTFNSGNFHIRLVLYSLKAKLGMPIFWVLHSGYSANGWGGGTNIWRSLKLGSQQTDLDEGQVPLRTCPSKAPFRSKRVEEQTAFIGEFEFSLIACYACQTGA